MTAFEWTTEKAAILKWWLEESGRISAEKRLTDAEQTGKMALSGQSPRASERSAP